jgi:hypothetical protein
MAGTVVTPSLPLNGVGGDRHARPPPGRGIPRLETGLDK